MENVTCFYECAQQYKSKELEDACLLFMDKHLKKVLESKNTMAQFPASSLVSIIKRDTFCASEDDIVTAVQRWAERRPEDDVRQVMENITWSRVCGEVVEAHLSFEDHSSKYDLR